MTRIEQSDWSTGHVTGVEQSDWSIGHLLVSTLSHDHI